MSERYPFSRSPDGHVSASLELLEKLAEGQQRVEVNGYNLVAEN
jgi:hypothetical protein